MRARIYRFVVINFIILAVAGVTAVTLSAVNSASAASPDDPALQPVSFVAQNANITFQATTSADEVELGIPVTFTLTIINNGANATDFTVTDQLPQGLALQQSTVTATVGTVEKFNGEHRFIWSGTLAEGAEESLTFQAIPPSTSQPDQSLSNAAVLEAGGRTQEASATIVTIPANLGIWGRFVNSIAWLLVSTDSWLGSLSVPFSFGFAIILFTVVVRLATFPLNMQQIKSSKAMQELQPKMKEIQEKYKNDREKLAQEQMNLYREHGVNPLGGCLPLLVQMPIWIALYRALLNLSTEGLLNEGFFWIPSLAGPVSGQQLGGGFIPPWLMSAFQGTPELGWWPTAMYLVLPILLVVSQMYMQQMMTPPTTDPQQAQMQQMMKFMPIMFGYFALVVPAGLTLYWFTSNILAMAQQYFTRTQLNIDQKDDKKKSAVISSPIPESAPVPAAASSSNSSISNGSSESASGESTGDRRKSKNAKRRKKKRR